MYQPVYHRLPPPFRGRSRPIYPYGKVPNRDPQAGADAPEASPMEWRYPILIFAGLCCSAWGFIYRPFPMPGENVALDLVLYHTPNFNGWVVR